MQPTLELMTTVEPLPFDMMPFVTPDEDARWQSVLERDGRADGTFVYGVSSTRIYCRPSCPARRPRRENARFFRAPHEAEAAGYRACQRCRPEQGAADAGLERVQRACRCIEASLDAPLSLDQLSQQVGGSSYHLQRTFKRALGISPRQYAATLRAQRFRAQTQAGESVTSALYEAGYGSTRGLYESAPAQLGMTPATYQRGGAGQRISFSIVPCALGHLLVAATPKGICSITLGDNPAVLEDDLRAEFPKAAIERDEASLGEHTATLLRHLEGEQSALNLPLDVQATAFQRRVWNALRAIGYGETRSYAQIAQELGQPTATRAVARACATNPTALAVPCHRVVRGDGSLSGYRWGIERKRTLLARESGTEALTPVVKK